MSSIVVVDVPQQLPLNIQLPDHASYANFIVGQNAALLDYLQQIPRKTAEQFIYLWGNLGSGRTHLLQAVCREVTNIDQSIFYFDCVGIQHYSPAILEGLESIGFIAIDNLDAIAENRMWQEAIFHLYNRVLISKTYVLFAAQSPPTQLKFSLADLVSRLSAAMIFQIHSLSDEEKIKAWQLRAQQRGLIINEEVVQFLLTRYNRDMTTLFHALDILDKASLETQRKLTIPFVKSVLKI